MREQAEQNYQKQLEKNLENMRSLLSQQISRNKAARSFTMPYQISVAQFQSFEDDNQYLAVGLVDGAIVVIDLTLGIEKFFLEKHPSEITSIAFYENKAILSGSVCGRVNISDLENMQRQSVNSTDQSLRFFKCQNKMDRRIPVAHCSISNEFGLGMAIDVEGNCRFYDLLRFKKMAKINASGVRIEGENGTQTNFRLLENVCITMTNDSMLGIIQGQKIQKDMEADAKMREEFAAAAEQRAAEAEIKAAAAAKGGKGAPVEEVEPEVLLDDYQENCILIPNEYSDDKKKVKSLHNNVQDIPEANFYV